MSSPHPDLMWRKMCEQLSPEVGSMNFLGDFYLDLQINCSLNKIHTEIFYKKFYFA